MTQYRVFIFLLFLTTCISSSFLLIHPALAQEQSKLQSFADFLKAVEKSDFNAIKTLPKAQIKDDGSFKRMQEHILNLYKGVEVKHSFLDDSNNLIDCVTVNSQPGLKTKAMEGKKIATPPKPSRQARAPKKDANTRNDEDKDVTAQLTKRRKDSLGNAQFCERDTIPMMRLTWERLSRFRNLDDFFYKRAVDDERDPKQPVPGDGDSYTHYWAHAKQTIDNHGGDSRLNVWKPNADPGWFSLSQHWYVGGSGNEKQTVEGGWQVAERKYGDTDPHLFIYYTSANYASGSGCYNLDCAGFVQINNSWVIGGKLSPVSTQNNTQYIFRMQWQFYEGNWWLFLQGKGSYVAVGYYPGSLYGSGQMSKFAQKIDYGGEVSSLAGDNKTGQMGSGKMANEGWQKAAYQRTIYYIDTNHKSHWAELTPVQNTASCYTVDLHNKASGSWATYLFFGGPKCPNP